MDENDNLFAEAIGKVKPIQNSDKVHIEKAKTKPITPPRNRTIPRSTQAIDLPTTASTQRPQAGQDEPWYCYDVTTNNNARHNSSGLMNCTPQRGGPKGVKGRMPGIQAGITNVLLL